MGSGRTTPRGLRFPGLHSGARAFFRALDREPCPAAWPGEDRVAYVAYVLGPLKALVGDLALLLEDRCPELKLEARVGASLAWPREVAPDSADCPVRLVRAWDHEATPGTSPLLFVSFSGKAIEIGIDAAGADPGASRRTRAALRRGEELCADAARLCSQGWSVGGPPTDPGPEEVGLTDTLRPWFAHAPLRLTRRFAWEPWLEEPTFVHEVADHFCDLRFLFEVMRTPRSQPATVASDPR